MKNINNPYNVKIDSKEIYSGIYEHTVPYGYYFESCGTSYGERIYTTMTPTNYYTVKKKDETDTDTNSE